MKWQELLQSQKEELEACQIDWKNQIEQLQKDHRMIIQETNYNSLKVADLLSRAMKQELASALERANRERMDLENAHQHLQNDFLKQLQTEQALSLLLSPTKTKDRGR